MYKQLPLSVTLRVDDTFDSFYAPEKNTVVIEALKYFCQQPQESFFYLWGPRGSGVSHLLQAVQNQVPHLRHQYLPLNELVHHPVDDVLAGLEGLDLIIFDDFESIAGKKEWELAVFHLYNQLRDSGKQLIVGSHTAPRELPIVLPDLLSRLQWGLSYSLQSLNDDEKKQALCFRAQGLGLRLGDDVMQFILTHCSRDIQQLMNLLDIMDKASLAEKRHLTIPFVKQVLGL